MAANFNVWNNKIDWTSYLEMQWKWKAWLHMPQATVHSSEVAEALKYTIDEI